MSRKRLNTAVSPIIGVFLLGLVLLSAAVYYRSVRILRFWEPALALSTPRVEFGEKVRSLFRERFGTSSIPGIGISGESVFVDIQAFTAHGELTRGAGDYILPRLGDVLLAVLEDPATRNSFDFILLASFFPSPGPGADFTYQQRRELTGTNEGFLSLLFSARPELLREHGTVFVTAGLPARAGEASTRLVELRFIRAGRQHISVLQELEAYAR